MLPFVADACVAVCACALQVLRDWLFSCVLAALLQPPTAHSLLVSLRVRMPLLVFLLGAAVQAVAVVSHESAALPSLNPASLKRHDACLSPVLAALWRTPAVQWQHFRVSGLAGAVTARVLSQAHQAGCSGHLPWSGKQ